MNPAFFNRLGLRSALSQPRRGRQGFFGAEFNRSGAARRGRNQRSAKLQLRASEANKRAELELCAPEKSSQAATMVGHGTAMDAEKKPRLQNSARRSPNLDA